jgi:hypothetical protein
MAKVRIQTRKKDAEGSEGGDGTLPQPATNGSARKRRQGEGAVDILARVLRTEGFLSWYKVRFACLLLTPVPFRLMMCFI